MRYSTYTFAIWLALLGSGVCAVNVNEVSPQLPQGRILGAALSDDTGDLFVQQVIFTPASPTNSAPMRGHIQLLAWDTAHGKLQLVKDTGIEMAGAHYPCGRLEVVGDLLVTCSAGSKLTIFNSATLVPVRNVGAPDEKSILDFAVDRRRGEITALSFNGDDNLYLTTFSLQTGQQARVLKLTSQDRVVRAAVAIRESSGDIAAAITRAADSGEKTEVYFCDREKSSCRLALRTSPLSQMEFWGAQLLYVTLQFADRKSDCVMALDVATSISRPAYCSRTGVHYGLAVIGKDLIAAYTGWSRRGLISEEVRQRKSSFSVWTVEAQSPEVVIEDRTDHGAFQNEIRLSGSRRGKFFVAYQAISSWLRIYEIE